MCSSDLGQIACVFCVCLCSSALNYCFHRKVGSIDVGETGEMLVKVDIQTCDCAIL